jgi:hypothetical protein
VPTRLSGGTRMPMCGKPGQSLSLSGGDFGRYLSAATSRCCPRPR